MIAWLEAIRDEQQWSGGITWSKASKLQDLDALQRRRAGHVDFTADTAFNNKLPFLYQVCGSN
jgi:hypothetical protein